MQDPACQQVQEKLLSAESVSGALAAHLQQCPECAALAAKLQRLETAARQMPEPVVQGPSEAFLETVRGLKLPERGAALRRVAWIRRSAAAAIIIAVGLMALSVCLMNQRSARADVVLHDLVNWNLQIGESRDPAERQKLYEQQVAGMKKEISSAALSAAEAALADALLKNAEWLEKVNDRLAEAAHFAAIAQQFKSAGINVTEMDALQKDLLTRGVKGNLQQVEPEQLSPDQKQQLQQLQQQMVPVSPAGPQSDRNLPTPQVGAIHAALPAKAPMVGNGAAAPATVAANRPAANAASTVVLRMLPPPGANNIAPATGIVKSGGATSSGISGWTAMGSGHATASSGSGSFGSTIPSPVTVSGPASSSMKGWVGNMSDPDRDSDTRMPMASGTTMGNVMGFGIPVPASRPPAIGGTTPDVQHGPRNDQITGQMISSAITGPTAMAGYFIPPQVPQHGSTNEFSPGVMRNDGQKGDSSGHGDDNASHPMTPPPSSTVASNSQGSSVSSLGASPGALVAVVSDGGVQHMIVTGGPGAATDMGDGGDGNPDHAWHHWDGQSTGAPGDTNGAAGDFWTHPDGWHWSADGSSASTSGTPWHGWQDPQGTLGEVHHATASGGGTLAPVTGLGAFSTVIVPEPAAGMIAVSGVMFLIMRRRRAAR